MAKQKVIIRDDLLSKSEFARQFSISRSKLDQLIIDRMVPVEVISGVSYVNIANKSVILNALQYNTSRNHTIKPFMPMSEEDADFERRWRESQGME